MEQDLTNEPQLTLDQAYLAAYDFIHQFYERDGLKPESMFHLITWMELERPRESSDPAMWPDWINSVAKITGTGTEELFAESVSQPQFGFWNGQSDK